MIQDQVNYISGGFDLHDITDVKEMLQRPIGLLSVYKINNNTIEELISYVKNSMLAENTESQIKQQTEIVNRLKQIYDNYNEEDFISVKKHETPMKVDCNVMMLTN